MSGESINCWRCGHALGNDELPLAREQTCSKCNADLHVCKICEFYNPRISDGCDEPVASPVTNKERANFCDYLKPSHRAFKAEDSERAAVARSELEALFGVETTTKPSSEADEHRQELNRLFGLDERD